MMLLCNVPGSFFGGYTVTLNIYCLSVSRDSHVAQPLNPDWWSQQRQLRHEVAWIKTIVPNGPEFAGKIRGPSVMIFINTGDDILYYWDTVC
jgi:hypothetical protein